MSSSSRNGENEGVAVLRLAELANVDAEMQSLGAALISRTAAEHVCEAVQDPDTWTHGLHRRIWTAMGGMVSDERKIDCFTVLDEMRRLGTADAHTAGYLVRLAEEVATAAHVADYVAPVLDLAARRRLIQASRRAASMASDLALPVNDAAESAARLMEEAPRAGRAEEFASAGDMSRSAMERLAETQRRAVSTGFGSLDRLIGGWKPGHLYVIGARPGLGKTSFACCSVLSASWGNVSSAFFSLEMTKAAIWTRFTSIYTGLSAETIDTIRDCQDSEVFEQWSRANAALSNHPLHVYDTSDATMPQIRAAARRVKRRTGSDLIVVDFLQRIRAERNREQDVRHYTDVATGLKNMAKELNLPVIALSSFSRDLEKRKDRHPVLSDFRESGGIESEADVAILIYSSAYYELMAGGKPPEPYVTEFNVAKNRTGKLGTVTLHYHASSTRFSDPGEEYGGYR